MIIKNNEIFSEKPHPPTYVKASAYVKTTM